METKIKHFTDLVTWQEGHKLALFIYKITHEFPKKETYALIDQMRRAAISVTSNIAEGFSRKSDKEKLQFYYSSLGSLMELESQIIFAKDIAYINETVYQSAKNQIATVQKLVNGMMNHLKTF